MRKVANISPVECPTMVDFSRMANSDPTATLLLTGDGTIVEKNLAAQRFAPALRIGSKLRTHCTDSLPSIADYLAACLRSCEAIPTLLGIRLVDGAVAATSVRLECAAVEPIGPGRLGLLVLRMRERHEANASFLRLESDIARLSKDHHEHRVLRKDLDTALLRFRSVFETANAGIAIVGLDGAWLEVNDQVCKFLGYERDQLLTLTFGDVTFPDDIDADVARVRNLIGGAFEQYSVQKRYIRGDGAVVWANLTVGLHKDEDGQPLYFVATLIDITSERKAQAALEQSEIVFRATFENAAVGMARTAVDGRFLDVNERACKILMRSRAELLATTWQSLTHPDDLAPSHNTRRRADAEKYDPLVKRFLGRDGQIIWVEVFTHAAKGADNQPIYYITAIVDITEKKSALEALSESEATLRMTFENAAVGIALSSHSGYFLRVNKTFCEMLGYTREELEGRHYSDVSLAEDDGQFSLQRKSLFEGLIPNLKFDKRYVRKDGRKIWARVTLATPKASALESQTIAIIEDIQAQKESEATRDLLIGEINHRVKNTLAIVQGIVRQTLLTSPEPVQFASAIEGRLQNLARAHDLLTESNWVSVSLSELITAALHEVFVSHADRIRYSGADVPLTAQQSISLMLVLHELATNAIKHGALSVGSGLASLEGRTEEASEGTLFSLRWQETGGPPAVRGDRKGFGSFLLERGAAFSLGGKVAWHFEKAGLVYELGFLLHNAEVPVR